MPSGTTAGASGRCPSTSGRTAAPCSRARAVGALRPTQIDRRPALGLTSAGFIIFLVVLTVASGAVTVRLWPRLAAKGVKPVLGRIGMLTLTQVVALLAVLAVGNRHYVFYSGWDDLLGTNTSQAQIKVVKARTGGPGPQPAPNANVNANAIIRPLGVKHGHRDPKVDGSLDAFHFRGRATGLSTDTYVMLPPQYYQPAYAR